MELNEVGAWRADWAWGLPLIVLTSVVHVLGLGLINEQVVEMLRRRMHDRHFTPLFAVAMSVTVLLATVLHTLEAAMWAIAYLLLQALPGVKVAMLYSLSAVTTYGHASALLPDHWKMLGALEALNGMLLFGLTTAFLFSMIQQTWPLGSRDPRGSVDRTGRDAGRAVLGASGISSRTARSSGDGDAPGAQGAGGRTTSHDVPAERGGLTGRPVRAGESPPPRDAGGPGTRS